MKVLVDIYIFHMIIRALFSLQEAKKALSENNDGFSVSIRVNVFAILALQMFSTLVGLIQVVGILSLDNYYESDLQYCAELLIYIFTPIRDGLIILSLIALYFYQAIKEQHQRKIDTLTMSALVNSEMGSEHHKTTVQSSEAYVLRSMIAIRNTGKVEMTEELHQTAISIRLIDSDITTSD